MITSPGQRAKELYEFGPFRVDPEKETLLREGEPVALTPKTFQILLVLIRHNEEVVTKDDLMKAVWPDSFVEEANLSRNISMLRKALGETAQDHRYIVTVPGQGYRLVENVHLIPDQEVNIVAATHSIVRVAVKESRPWPGMARSGSGHTPGRAGCRSGDVAAVPRSSADGSRGKRHSGACRFCELHGRPLV
jgi:eukaryotic-like serine/threonine-protein kinase